MSGATSRSGFAFQDLVLAERVLAMMLARRAATIVGVTIPDLRFGVEAAPRLGRTPEWDCLQASEEGGLFLEEVKSGAIDAEDRWTLWRRVRRTVGGLTDSDASNLSIRLTVNAAALPPNPEYWRSLPARSQSAAGEWSTPGKKNDGTDERRRGVRSAKDLANEALHILTCRDADRGSEPLGVDQARSLLGRFSMDERHSTDSIELAVRNQLGALSRGAGIEELLAGLRGEISQRAESKNASHRFFGVDEMARSFSMLDRLATIDPDVLRQWQELRASAMPIEPEPEASSIGLPYQHWKTLQPSAFETLKENCAAAVALLGRGGIGKSVILHRYLAERRREGDETLFLPAAALAALRSDEISRVLDLGAFSARHRGHRLVVGVDGLEDATADRRLTAVLTALRSAAVLDVSVCVTCRLLEWRSARGSDENIADWKTVELVEWPEDTVRGLASGNGRRRTGADLTRLLRTPLLLDLFLRTFGIEAEIPAGLQTRHGLIQAYWERRILPPEDERSAERLAILVAIAAAEATGIDAHNLVGDAAQDLTSEGLLVLRGGRRSFRHALLRDFAMMEWVRDGSASTKATVEKLDAIQPPLVQFGALRAVFEASSSIAVGASMLSTLEPQLLFAAGTVLGEFDDSSPLNLPAIVEAVRQEHRAGFLHALLTAIKLDRNAEGLKMWARLPDDSGWAEQASWLTPSVFMQVIETSQTMSDELAGDAALSFDLASRLRTWSLATRLLDDVSGADGYSHGRLAKLLATLDPSPQTLAWLSSIAGVGAWSRFWTLSELPALVKRMSASARNIDDDVLQRVYRTAAGLRDDAGTLRDDPSVPRNSISGYERIEHVLLGRRNSAGLIRNRPSAFVAIAVDMIAGREADDADQRQKEIRELMAKLPPDLKWFNDMPEEVQEAERKARTAAGDEPLVDAGGMLIVDSLADSYWEFDADYAQILLHLRELAEDSLAGDHGFFDVYLWPAVARSRSALMRVCVLDLLTRQDACAKEQVLDELLRDGRLYFLWSARRYLQRGIRARWPSLPENDRAVILGNIRACGRAPTGNPYLPGPFLAAIATDDRPADCAIFVELFRLRDLNLEIDEGQPSTAGVRLPEAECPWVPIAGLSDAHQSCWQQVAEWNRGTIAQATAEQWSSIVAVVDILISQCLPAPEALVGRAELVERLAEFASVHAAGNVSENGRARLGQEALRNLARWSLDALPSFAPSEVIANCEPFDGLLVGLPPIAELWTNLAVLADSILFEGDLKNDEELNGALFSAIGNVAAACWQNDEKASRGTVPGRLAWNFLARVRGWFRAKAAGKGVLWNLLTERVRDSSALVAGMRFLEAFDRTEQKVLVKQWLVTALSPPISPPRVFARDAGQHIGWAAMTRYENGAPTGSFDVIRKLTAAPSDAGLLSDVATHALFVGQSVFGAKEALVNGGISVDRVSEFAVRMQECWNALLPSLDESERRDAPAFALWVFHPILDTEANASSALKLTPAQQLTWWRALHPLALAIIRDGPSREVASLFYLLSRSRFLSDMEVSDFVEVLDALHVRTTALTQQSLGHHWHDIIGGASSVVEALSKNAADSVTRNRLYTFVAAWAAPPLAMDSAGAAAKRLRGLGAS